MVRLKDNNYCKNGCGYELFQFLMVRLKVSDWSPNKSVVDNFNSLWCD